MAIYSMYKLHDMCITQIDRDNYDTLVKNKDQEPQINYELNEETGEQELKSVTVVNKIDENTFYIVINNSDAEVPMDLYLGYIKLSSETNLLKQITEEIKNRQDEDTKIWEAIGEISADISNVKNDLSDEINSRTEYDSELESLIDKLEDDLSNIELYNIVDSLPESGSTNILYLVPSNSTKENSVFDEYLWVNDKWELIGSISTELDIDSDKIVTRESVVLDDYSTELRNTYLQNTTGVASIKFVQDALDKVITDINATLTTLINQ